MLIQIILSLVFALAVYLTWKRARQHAVRPFEAVLWTVLWLAAAIVVWRPETASVVAHLVGVGRGADLVVYLSIVLLLVLVFQLYAAHERMEKNITELVRREALRKLDDSCKSQVASEKTVASDPTCNL